MNTVARCRDPELVSSLVSEVSLVCDSPMESQVQALTAWIAPGCPVGVEQISFVNLEKVKRLPPTKTDHTQLSPTRSPGWENLEMTPIPLKKMELRNVRMLHLPYWGRTHRRRTRFWTCSCDLTLTGWPCNRRLRGAGRWDEHRISCIPVRELWPRETTRN